MALNGAAAVDMEAGTEHMRLLVCSSEPQGSSCNVLRIASPLQCDPDIEVRWIDLDTARIDVDWADAILVQRSFPTRSLAKRAALRRIYASGKPVFYELDDNLFETPESNPNYLLHKGALPYLRRILERAHVLIVSTDTLAAQIGKGTKECLVLPNLLDDSIWGPVPPAVREGPVTIGFAGSPTHGEDLMICLPALKRLAEEHGDGVRFLFMGCSLPEPELLPNSTSLPFQESYEAYARAIMDAGIDVGIAPLVDTPFNRSKSAIKWMEMSMCGIAGVYADLEPYRVVVDHGRNGLLAGPDWEEWHRCLDRLVRDTALRRKMAEESQRDVLSRHVAKGERCVAFARALRAHASRLRSSPEAARLGWVDAVRNFLWH